MKQVFINIPVASLDKSMEFYKSTGFTLNPEFTGNNQICMVWSDHIYVMLQSQDMFRKYIKKEIPDAKHYAAASYTLPVESIERVNTIVANALEAGGKEPIPMIDEGFMQIRTIEDLDGHTWGIIYLAREKFRKR